MYNRSKKPYTLDKGRIYDVLSQIDLSSFLQLSGLGFLLLTIQIWQLRGYGRISILTFCLAVLCICCASTHVVRHKNMLTTKIQSNTLLLFFIETLLLVIICSNHRDIVAEIDVLREFIVIIGLLSCVAIQLCQFLFTTHKKRMDKALTLEFSIVGVLCIFFGILLNIECFNAWVRWDSYNYFRSFDNLSPASIFIPGDKGLKISGHIATSYALWSLMFLSIPWMSTSNALYLSNMCLVAIDFVVIYLIFKKIHPKRSIFLNMLFSATVVCTPWILGSVSDLNAEHILLTGVLLLIYSVLNENSILGVFATFIVCTARETGAVVAAAIIFVKLLLDCYKCDNITGRRGKINYLYFCFCLFVGVLWLLQYRKGNWSAGRTPRAPLLDGSTFNTFGFSILHILDVLIAGLITNLNWASSTLILVAVLLFFVQAGMRAKEEHSYHLCFSYSSNAHGKHQHLRKRIPIIDNSCIAPCVIAIGILVFLAENCAYITYNLYRYYTVSSVLLCILALYSLSYICNFICNRSILVCIATFVLGCLFCLQSYTSIDPVSALIYPSIDAQKINLVPLPEHTSDDIDPSFTDSARNNRQVLYFDKAMDRAYEAVFDDCAVEGTKLLLSNGYVARVTDNRTVLGSLYCIWGFGYSVLDPPMWGHWNSEGGYRYLSYEQADNIDPSYVLADTDLSYYLNDYEHVYYIEMPWGDTVIEPLMERYPNISFDQTIEYRGWVLKIYKVK